MIIEMYHFPRPQQRGAVSMGTGSVRWGIIKQRRKRPCSYIFYQYACNVPRTALSLFEYLLLLSECLVAVCAGPALLEFVSPPYITHYIADRGGYY